MLEPEPSALPLGDIPITSTSIQNYRHFVKSSVISQVYLSKSTNPDEAAYQEILDSSHATVHHFVAADARDGFVLSPVLTEDILAKYAPDLNERHAYISGPPVMVASVKRLIKGRAQRVKTDYISGY